MQSKAARAKSKEASTRTTTTTNEERQVLLIAADVIGNISIGNVDTRCPRCWVFAAVGDANSSPAVRDDLIHVNDIIVKIDGKEPHPMDGEEVAYNLRKLSGRKKGVKVTLRSPTANDYMYKRSIPHELVQKWLGDYFGFEENNQTGAQANDGTKRMKYKWTGKKAAAVYKALLFCNSCSAIWWVHHRDLEYDDYPTCPICECCEDGGVHEILVSAPNV